MLEPTVTGLLADLKPKQPEVVRQPLPVDPTEAVATLLGKLRGEDGIYTAQDDIRELRTRISSLSGPDAASELRKLLMTQAVVVETLILSYLAEAADTPRVQVKSIFHGMADKSTRTLAMLIAALATVRMTEGITCNHD